MTTRDPRIDPKSGDVLRKWNQLFTVTYVTMGCVFTHPALTESGWLGILFFQRWAEDTEIVEASHF